MIMIIISPHHTTGLSLVSFVSFSFSLSLQPSCRLNITRPTWLPRTSALPRPWQTRSTRRLSAIRRSTASWPSYPNSADGPLLSPSSLSWSRTINVSGIGMRPPSRAHHSAVSYIWQKGSIVGPAWKAPFIGPFLQSMDPKWHEYKAKWDSGELSCVSVFHK